MHQGEEPVIADSRAVVSDDDDQDDQTKPRAKHALADLIRQPAPSCFTLTD